MQWHPSAAFLFAVLILTAVAAWGDDDPLRPAAIAVENVPAVPPELAERLRQYDNVRSATFMGWSPDGNGMVVQTRFGNTGQLHRVYMPEGRREQITFYDEPAAGGFIPENADSLLVSMSLGGNENYQIYRHDLASGRGTLMTDGASRNEIGPVSDDGQWLLFTSNRRNGRDSDIYRMSTSSPYEYQLVREVENEFWVPEDLSLDGKRALLNMYVSINETYPAILDLETLGQTPIPPPEGATSDKVAFGIVRFAKDGQNAFVCTDARGEFQELASVNLDTFEYTWLSEDIPWDVDGIVVDEATGHVAFTVNEDGATKLYIYDGENRRAIDTPLGIVEGMEFSPDGKRLGCTIARPDAPADAYSIDLASGEVTRWTFSEVGGLDTSRFVTPERITFPSFDDREIPAYVFKPSTATDESPAAVVINIHGGPEAQYRPYFSSFDQFLLTELGIAVIRPNVRGSAGYGKTYLQLDNAALREDSVMDIGALLDWIAEQPDLDGSRVAVMGGSYGGYMVLGSMVHFSDRLRAGVDIVGIASFKTFLENTAEYRRDLRRAEYGDERDPMMLEVFARIDPLHNAHRITSPLMVIHGINDPRVPFSEAEQIAPIVRQNDVPVWTVYADNEGHGFAKQDNREYMNAAMAMFLEEFLGDDDDVALNAFLDAPVTFNWNRTTIEQAFQDVGEEFNVQAKLDAEAFEFAGYTRNMTVTVPAGEKSCQEWLKHLINPSPGVVVGWDKQAQTLWLTTQDGAEAKGIAVIVE
jgi:prolyl oligopeptidase PreP (S9A serine peptidase family)